ncbi:unnamed protein product [Rhodiola kirilowii]
MGRGRAPCCDKSQVIRGPWSPAEDLRLICYIQKYGHDNWRALPKQAGLLRCGKSCRLRWINYLRPDLKRGNFTAKEEETIIKLHESIGNKWSRIAAHFPGRTDNEIKNVWNTHLKKRLLAKKAAEYKEDVTKETSAITSASSSSSTTVELSHENHKIEIESQIKLLPSDGSSEKTIFAPNKSIVANQVPQLLQDFESVNKVGSSIHQQSDQLFDSADINQLEEFTMWEDPNLLESLLSAVESHEWVLAPPDTRVDYTKNNSSCELRTESGIDLWNVLNNDDQPAPAKPVEVPMSQKSMNAAHEYITDNDIDSMFEYLENDPGLARISMEMCQNPGQYQGGDDLNHRSPATATGNVVNGSPFMDYFPIWPPQSPN